MLRFIWPERELNTNELNAVTYKYIEAAEVNHEIDHITCHADGRFHIKTKSGEPIYIQRMQRVEPLGPNTSKFLELIIISDSVQFYGATTEPIKYPHIWVDLQEDYSISFRGMFSGVNYNVENDMFATMSQFAGVSEGVTLTSGTLKGVLLGRPVRVEKAANQSRPRGTILSLKFPIGENRWHIKSFLFC